MRNLEEHMVETGRVVHGRYLLQRLIKQGRACAVYQGFDQILQRAVALKITPAEHIAAYRGAIRTTSQFAHPNIIGIYDLIVEPETLYIVEEYVEGDDFSALLQKTLAPYQVADLGAQICQALMYAGAPSRRVCHGDLTPSSIIRDRRGLVRVNNFALPSDLDYFAAWSVVGNDGAGVSDPEMPWGQQSDGRRADDVRAVGLLLYQLLTSRPPGTATVDPPLDGRLRFVRSVPPELCEIIARAVIRQHPQHIATADVLHSELKALAEALEPPVVATPQVSSLPAGGAYQTENLARPRPVAPVNTENLVTSLPGRETAQAGAGFPSFRSELNAPVSALDSAPAAPTVADMPVPMTSANQFNYPQTTAQPRRVSLGMLALICLVLFGLFFVVGFFLSQAIFAH
jgi:serine/threonine protein kinase